MRHYETPILHFDAGGNASKHRKRAHSAGAFANCHQNGSIRQCLFHTGLPVLVLRTAATSLRRTEQPLSEIAEGEPEPASLVRRGLRHVQCSLLCFPKQFC